MYNFALLWCITWIVDNFVNKLWITLMGRGERLEVGKFNVTTQVY